jgi:type VI secretion system protein VasG
MLRGILGPMEKHHGVRISDAAIVAAVQLSQRYIPARQLPDKAVSLLDTASARVAVSQSATPAAIEDTRALILAREKEKAGLLAERDLGIADEQRITEIDAEIEGLQEKLARLESDWREERGLVEQIRSLREILHEPGDEGGEKRVELRAKANVLEEIDPEKRMVYAHVDEQAVASVVSDWTGIPVGRMVKDEVETVLALPDILNRRVIGQSHGLRIIAKRIETNRAKLDNPNKPIGVFMLCGPSGVGKTETALALAEALYGGEQNMITINMSEFQEAHTVSTLKGAPPGYVGYGEGGRLTEAVRRKPYSVILLDEVEKAHRDVHEIFFQVFDKGQMEDGTGRRIDFKNTLIILTSNVGTDLIMELGRDPAYATDPDALAAALRPELLRVFPAALLGRIVAIPYFPLSNEVLGGIVRLQLDRVGKRIRENHDALFTYDDAVVEHIVSLCNDLESGGRMIDNIITNTLLPALSREFLKRSIAREELKLARVMIADGAFAYEWQASPGGGARAPGDGDAEAGNGAYDETSDAARTDAPLRPERHAGQDRQMEPLQSAGEPGE